MISVGEAQALIERHLPKWKFGLPEVRADRAYPPFDRVMMDGIAVKFEQYSRGQREFRIEGVSPAGEPQKTLRDGALEVMTGAPLPLGADLVIPYEEVEIKNSLAVVKDAQRTPFEFVHRKGSDCGEGDVILREGAPLNGPHVGIAASMGAPFKPRYPKVLIISTGDELVDKDPLPHQIRKSNAYALEASLGFPVTLAHLGDDPKEVAEHFATNRSSYDLFIYSGGVSKGKFDFLPAVWRDLGVTKYFHEVSQRPGKPLWFGVEEKSQTAVLGLPGNPVSSLVCLHRYLIPGREMYARLEEEITFKKPLTFFVPVKISFSKDGVLGATPVKIKNSGEFTALAETDGFIELPQEREVFKKGDSFRFFPWRIF